MNFLWLCLDFAMDAAGDDKIVELITEKNRRRDPNPFQTDWPSGGGLFATISG